jgi:hypothetical protein
MSIHDNVCMWPHSYAAGGGEGDEDGRIDWIASRNEDLESELWHIDRHRIRIEGRDRDLGRHCFALTGNGSLLEIQPRNVVLGQVRQLAACTDYQQQFRSRKPHN